MKENAEGGLYHVRTVVAPDFAMSAKAAFMLAVLRPINPTQYELELIAEFEQDITRVEVDVSTYPITVYLAPFNVNLVPDVLTNPVDAGGGAVEVGGVVVGAVVGFVVGEVVGPAPGRHWEYQSFE